LTLFCFIVNVFCSIWKKVKGMKSEKAIFSFSTQKNKPKPQKSMNEK
jgi:hypothetical protein